MNINSEKGDIFWQSICRRFNLQFLGLSKLHMENCFGFVTKYFISEGYQAGRSFYFIPRGSYLLVKTKLFSHIKFIPIIVDRVTDFNSVDCWSIGKDLYRETIIKFFEFYSSLDKFAFSFEEIDNCSFDDELFIQTWKENRTHIIRKGACLQKLKGKREILNNKNNRFEYIPKSLESKENLDQNQQRCKEKEVDNRSEYKQYKTIDNWSTEEDNKDGYYLTPLQINNNSSRKREKKYNKNVTYCRKRLMKKKGKRLYNDENSDDNNANTHSDFLLEKQ
jgi:hypothetical protein